MNHTTTSVQGRLVSTWGTLLLAGVLVQAGVARAQDEGHDKFSITDLKVGQPLLGHEGFVCHKQTPDEVKDRRELHCVKFTDPRCKGKPSAVGELRYGEDAPRGCFLDYSNSATYLDGKLLQTPNTNDSSDKRPILKPLTHLHLTGTRSVPAKIYRISYFVPPDMLTEDTKLYQAMTAKYGEPSYKNPPIDMRWKNGDTALRAECVTDRHCEIWVEDSKFGDLERKWQEEADAKQKAKNAPAAPPL